MGRQDRPRLHPGRFAAGGLVALVIAGAGCASLQRDLRPMTDAEAIERHQHDPRFADPFMSPWERERRDQQLRWELAHAESQ